MAPALQSSATPNDIIGKETSKLQSTAVPCKTGLDGIAVVTCHGTAVATKLALMGAPRFHLQAGSVTRRWSLDVCAPQAPWSAGAMLPLLPGKPCFLAP